MIPFARLRTENEPAAGAPLRDPPRAVWGPNVLARAVRTDAGELAVIDYRTVAQSDLDANTEVEA